MNNKNDNKGDALKSNIIIAMIVVILIALFNSCDGGSSSGTKWSDLSDVEKENARWAYEVQQSLND